MTDLHLTWPADGGKFESSPEMAAFLLSMSLPDDDDTRLGCHAVCEGPLPFGCTRERGHSGLHLAVDSLGFLCAVWGDGFYQNLCGDEWCFGYLSYEEDCA